MTKWVSGEWYAICDICGLEFYASELHLDYRGLRVCKKDLDKRNPQEFVRSKSEKVVVPWVRPDLAAGDEIEVQETAAAGAVTITASDNLLTVDPQGAGVTCTLPETTEFTVDHTYVITNLSDTEYISLAITGSDVFSGSSRILQNSTATIRSINTQHKWVRDL